MSMERAHINTDIYKVLSKICNNHLVEISMRLASTGIVIVILICTVPICWQHPRKFRCWRVIANSIKLLLLLS